ncbi:hypothetical protein DL96DRAFT_669965 [Flagelloscypha sp. PMI_526]|nr:hypothetical protein DL96DRAFT_669965 [Flagelloscypha sp. PMI_526]
MTIPVTERSCCSSMDLHFDTQADIHNVDCDECVQGFTADCTDECHLVPCNDEVHNEAECKQAILEAQSLPEECEKIGCETGRSCPWGGPAHCPNFARFIKTEFFPEYRSGNSPTSRHLTLPFDPNAPCLVSLPPSTLPDNTSSDRTTTSSHGSDSPPSMDLDFPRSLLGQDIPSRFDSASMEPHSASSSISLPSMSGISLDGRNDGAFDFIRCLWSECNETFSNTHQLAAHVTLKHINALENLGTSAPAPIGHQHHASAAPQPGALPALYDQLMSPGHIQCLWKDCDSLPDTIMSVAGPSTQTHPPPPMEVLMSHLLQDHLRLPVNAAPNGGNFRGMFPFDVPSPLGRQISPTSPMSNSPTFDLGTTPEVDNRIYICHWENCGRVCDNSETLNHHIVEKHVGSGKAHYDCHWAGCDRHGAKGFASKQKVCRHIQSHTGHKPFMCDICQQCFSEAATLQQHMRRHTRERPCVCDFPGCKKTFATTGALTIHKRIHDGVKPFKCTYCDKAFTESSNLAKHLRTHTGEKPYPCPEHNCGKAFARPDQLTRHLAVHAKKRGPMITN